MLRPIVALSFLAAILSNLGAETYFAETCCSRKWQRERRKIQFGFLMLFISTRIGISSQIADQGRVGMGRP